MVGCCYIFLFIFVFIELLIKCGISWVCARTQGCSPLFIFLAVTSSEIMAFVECSGFSAFQCLL